MDRKYQFCLFVCCFCEVMELGVIDYLGGGVIDYFFFFFFIHCLSFRYHRLDLLGIKYLVTCKLPHWI